MTNNVEKQNSDVNSHNSPKSAFNALDRIRQWIEKDTARHLQIRASADAFIRKHLLTETQAQKYVEGMWSNIKTNETAFAQIELDSESLNGRARKLRRDFLAKAAVSESRRNGIETQLFQEYDLNDDQKTAVREHVSHIPAPSLRYSGTPSGRNIIIWDVCQKMNVPVPTIRKVSERLNRLFGSSAKSFDATAMNVIQSAMEDGFVEIDHLKLVWDQLDEKGRSNLLSILSNDLSMQTLNSIDKTLFTKSSLLESVRKNISQNVSQEILDLLKNPDSTDLDAILEDLTWSDISDASLDGEHVIGLMKHDLSFPTGLTEHFNNWLQDHLKVEQLEKDKISNGAKIENKDSSPLESITPEWVQGFLRKHGSPVTGMELMLNSEFLNGTEKLICSQTLPNGKVSHWQIETGINVLNAHEWNHELHIVELNSEYEPDYGKRKLSLLENFNELFKRPSELKFETTEGFYSRMGKSVPSDSVSVGDIDFSPYDPNAKGTLQAKTKSDSVVYPEGLNPDIVDSSDPETQEQLKRATRGSNTENDSMNTSETPPVLPNTLPDFKTSLAKHLKIESLENKFRVGTCFSIGKPGSEKYVIYRVQSLGEDSLKVWGGTNERAAEDISYADLFRGIGIEKNQFKLLDNQLDNHKDLLSIMQSDSTQGEAWKKVEVIEKDGSEFFDFVDRRFDPSRVKKQYFPGNEGHIIEIISIQNGVVRGRIGEKFDKGKDGWAAEWGPEEDLQLHFVTGYMGSHSCVPWNEPPREIHSKELPKGAETTKGTLKHVFGRLSVHDIMSGMNKFTETFKHHLQHGNHLQERRVMLGIAKRIGMDTWNMEWYNDYKSEYENGEKGLIEERLKKLAEMATPLRHKTIRASVLNNGTHDYDHWTNALSMLEKHGHLYAGGLQDLEGSWIFFKRIANIPLNADVNKYEAFQSAVEEIRKRGIDNITEEAVIEAYMQKNPHFPNAKIWLMVKANGKNGNDSEFTAGGNEVEQYNNLDQRLNYVMGKLKSREYANAIGALEKVFDKEGPAWKKQSVAFLLVMSRIPERLPRSLMDKFVEIYDKGRLHSPALHFIKDRSSQEKFREAVKAIVAVKKKRLEKSGSAENAKAGQKMQDRFDEMMKSIRTNADQLKHTDHGAPLGFNTDMFDKVEAFWKKYGSEIQMELTKNTQGDIMIAESLYDDYPALKEYSEAHTKNLSDTNVSYDPEISQGTTFMEGDAGSGVISSRPDKILEKMGIQGHHGGFSTGTVEKLYQKDFRNSMEEIRDKENFTEKDKKAWFKKVYIAYVSKIVGTYDLEKFLKHETVLPFGRLGLTPPLSVNKETNDLNMKAKEKYIGELQLEITKHETEIQLIKKWIGWNQSPTQGQNNELTRLNKAIIEIKQKISNENVLLKEMEAAGKRYETFDPSNEEHRKHFEAQFVIFKNSGGKSWDVIDDVSNNVASIISGDDANISEGWRYEYTNDNS